MGQPCALRLNSDRVLDSWITLSKERFSAATDKSRQAVRDHLPDLMSLLCEVVETGILQNPKHVSKIHGQQRHSFGDYTLPQLIGEYSILKNLVFDELKSDRADSVDLIRLVDLFFDVSISSAATEFSKLREKELVDASQLLEESNLDLARFAGVAAHDLRSPAGTIIGYSELLIDSKGNQDVAAKAATTIHRTAKKMIELIDQLLAYAKLGKENLPFVGFDSLAAVTNTVEMLGPAIKAAHAEVQIKKMPHLFGDPVLIAQLFQNLIANSLKFCSPERKCKISIESSEKDGFHTIHVRDNGIGFDPKFNTDIFAPFKRAHEHLPIQGSGIGLATVQRIVKFHGGSITAKGVEGQGASFEIRLPVAMPR